MTYACNGSAGSSHVNHNVIYYLQRVHKVSYLQNQLRKFGTVSKIYYAGRAQIH